MSTNPGLNNPWNQLLQSTREKLSGASRTPIVPSSCQTPSPQLSPAQQTQQDLSRVLSVPINAFTAGDNLVIPTLTGKKLIYEVVLWNVAAQTLAFYQGPSASGILLMRLTSFPAVTGFTLGFNGNFAMPHFTVDNGQPLVLNLAASTQVDGMIKYRIL